jgi:restriction system protein
MGYRDVQHVGGSGDLAADLKCRDGVGRSVVVQCKRYAPGVSIGSPEVQKFIGMVTVHHQAERGIFVTTSVFTAPAVRLARQHDIELIDGRDLANLVARVNGGRTLRLEEVDV